MMKCPRCREPLGIVAPARIATLCMGSTPDGGADFVLKCPGTHITARLDSRPQRNPCRVMIAVSFARLEVA
jgi:hypothetical protein